MIAGEKIDPEVIAKLGYIEAQSADAARGGPFDPASQADPTFKSLFTSWKKLDNLADGAIAIPSEKPVRTAEFTSGYGTRTDPFRGGAARHQGIDLAAPIGTPIYATADGMVTAAGLEQRRLRQPHQARPWPRHRDPLRPPVADPGQPGPAHRPRPADRPYGLDRPFDRQPPPL